MFLEAFPLPQEQGGTTPQTARAPIPRVARPVGRCEYHTAICAAFQLEVGRCPPLRVDSARGKVQTFLARRRPEAIPCFVRVLPFITHECTSVFELRKRSTNGIESIQFGRNQRSSRHALRAASDQLTLKTRRLVALFRNIGYLLLPKLMLRGGGTASPLRCRCKRSSWSIAR